MGYTAVYNLGFLEPGQSDYPLDLDERRFRTIEAQVLSIYALFGNGVLDQDPLNPSWRLQTNPSDNTNLSLLVTPGQGHVAFMNAQTSVNAIVGLGLPPGGTYPATFWVYARANDTTPDQMTVTFFASTAQLTDSSLIGLGAATVSLDAQGNILPPVCFNDAVHGRVNISLFAALASIVNKHVHIGGSNPSPIDLGLHVQGKLSGDHISNLDLSTVTMGTLAPERLPVISHDSLSNRGTLNHTQIDSVIGSLLNPNGSRLSDIGTANLLQIALGIKRNLMSTIDANTLNMILYIPGITSTSYEATGVPGTIALANIDHAGHQVVGSISSATGNDTLLFKTALDWTQAIAQGQARTVSADPSAHDAVQVGSGVNGAVTIATPVGYLGVAGADLSAWVSGYHVDDNAAKVVPGSTPPPNIFADRYGYRRYLYLPFGSPVDWSARQKLGVGYGLSSASAPGDVYVFLIFASGGSSMPLVLTTGGTATSISISTASLLRPSAETPAPRIFKAHNLSEFGTPNQLSQVVGVGFYWQTVSGWDSNEVDFNLVSPTRPEINYGPVSDARESGSPPDVSSSLFIWNVSNFVPTARLVIRFNSNSAATQYTQVNWQATLPTGQSTQFAVSTRTANTEVDLANSLLFPVPSSGPNANLVDAGSRTGQFIDVVVDLSASPLLNFAPTITLLSLAYDGPNAATSKTWATAADWNSGQLFENILVDGSQYLRLADSSAVGRFTYVRGGNVLSAFSKDGSDEQLLLDGSALPQSPSQARSGSVRGFSGVRDVSFRPNGHAVVCDTVNDRVVEVDAAGNLVRMVQGNIGLRRTVDDFWATTCAYNPRLGQMWVTFNQNVTVTDRTKMTIATASGTSSLPLGGTSVNVVLFLPINGKSATLLVTFTEATRESVNAWAGPMAFLIGSGAVTTAGTSSDGIAAIPTAYAQSTSGSGSGGSGSGGSGSGGSGSGGSGSGGSGSGVTCDNTIPTSLTGLYQVLALGTVSRFDGLDGPTPGCPGYVAPPSGTISTGTVSNQLHGPNNQVGQVVLPVDQGEIVFDNLFQPVSIQVTPAGNWVVASVGASCVTSYDQSGTPLWTIPTTVVSLREGAGGSAYEMTSGNVLVAETDTTGAGLGELALINRPAGNVPLARLPVNGDAVRAVPVESTQEYWAALDDILGDGRSSRVVRMNSAGRVVFTWGAGTLLHPTGLALLPNGDLLVSE